MLLEWINPQIPPLRLILQDPGNPLKNNRVDRGHLSIVLNQPTQIHLLQSLLEIMAQNLLQVNLLLQEKMAKLVLKVNELFFKYLKSDLFYKTFIQC